MKSAWAALDRRLQSNEAWTMHAIGESRLRGLRWRLRPLALGQSLQLVAGVLGMLVFAPYWVGHRDALQLMIAGLLLHAYALMLAVFAARDLVALHRIDYAAPVLAIQRELAALRARRVRSALAFGIVGCFMWIPMLMWLFDVAFGVNLYVAAPGMLAAFLASGFACLALLLGVIRWARDPRRARFSRTIEDDAAGRSLGRAERFLERIAAFERED